jgi:hypothetical protein
VILYTANPEKCPPTGTMSFLDNGRYRNNMKPLLSRKKVIAMRIDLEKSVAVCDDHR